MASQQRTQKIQNEVNEVVGIMQDNIEKVMERGEKIEVLQDKTDDLQNSATKFKKGANRVRKAMWWKDMKLKLIIVVVIIVIVLAIACKFIDFI